MIKHCMRSETLEAVLKLILTFTDGGNSYAPSYLFYDRACNLQYFILGLLRQPSFRLSRSKDDQFGKVGKIKCVLTCRI